MGRFEFDIPDDIFDGLGSKMIDEIAPECINESLPIYEEAVKKTLSLHSRTGDLVKSVSISKAKQGKNGGWFGSIKFTSGTDNHPNVVKAAGLEYGNSHQKPTPFIQTATNSCKDKVIETMQNVINERLS